ncbi:ADP-ribosylation factor-like protein 4A [Petromyzon marinus]|uniref:ADP-ribosylation factor-like protein 11 n=2 Tax=Petromyzon marinus TaxID=7757 RepID=A0AAJ7SN72_PETMA|nr:ADP-ribosylation factor-like protein 4A [Petromyzon marinus]XP_032802405.1 ADP-ribosylation factor-like protein 4A [Petromyzon marinus]
MGNGLSGDNPVLANFPSFQPLHVAIIGLDSAGKTTLLCRLKLHDFVHTAPTIGFNTERLRVTLGQGRVANFHFWDVGGQEKVRPLWKSYTRCADGIVFVTDASDPERVEEARTELHRIARTAECQGVPFLVVANKQDLPDALPPHQLEKLLTLTDLGPTILWHIQPVCAVTGQGVYEGLDKLYEMILKRRKVVKWQKKNNKQR